MPGRGGRGCRAISSRSSPGLIQGTARIIVRGSPAKIQTLVTRYGATVRKTLRGGAVLSVSAGQLDALSQDDDVDHLSGDVPVMRMGAETPQAIGADQVWSGVTSGGWRLHGRGHWRRRD